MEKDIKDVSLEEYFSIVSNIPTFSIDAYSSRVIYSMREVLKNAYMVQGNVIGSSELNLLRRNANKNKDLMVSDVLMDLLSIGKNPSKMEREYLCIKYMHPQEVIDEIIDGGYDKKYGIIHSKIYQSYDVVAKLIKEELYTNKDVSRICSRIPSDIFLNIKPITTNGGIMLGGDYTKIYKYIHLENTTIWADNTKYISLAEANKILEFTNTYGSLAYYVVDKELPVFDVIIRHKHNNGKAFLNLDDINLANKNKKYFIRRSDVVAYTEADTNIKTIVNGLLRIKYKNYISTSVWINKKISIDIHKLCKLYSNNTYTSNEVTMFTISIFLDYYKNKTTTISLLATILGFPHQIKKHKLSKDKGFFGVKFTNSEIKNDVIPTSKAIKVLNIRNEYSLENMSSIYGNLSTAEKRELNCKFKDFRLYQKYIHKDKVQDFKDMAIKLSKKGK